MGPKQAPRAWFECLSKALLNTALNSKIGSSLLNFPGQGNTYSTFYISSQR